MKRIYKIAIVDDEDSILEMLERFFSKRKHFEVTTFLKPDQAYEKIKNGGFDIVLLDIMMPEINGIELFKMIKQHNPSQKVVMMTASSTQNRLIECDREGVADYVTKPFLSLRDVENIVLDCLE